MAKRWQRNSAEVWLKNGRRRVDGPDVERHLVKTLDDLPPRSLTFVDAKIGGELVALPEVAKKYTKKLATA